MQDSLAFGADLLQLGSFGSLNKKKSNSDGSIVIMTVLLNVFVSSKPTKCKNLLIFSGEGLVDNFPENILYQVLYE